MSMQLAGSRLPVRVLRRLARPGGRRLVPRRTVRLRLTALYGVLFLVSGAALLAIASGVTVSQSSASAAPANPAGNPAAGQPAEVSRLLSRVHQLQQQLASASAPSRNGLSHDLVIGSAVALGIMTLISVGLGWIVSGRALRPLRTMTATTRRISEDNLHERLAMPGPGDEMKDLADTIDGLLARLEAAFAAQRRFVANASHELRTPLTTMRASLDVAVAKPEPAPPQTIALAGRLRTELDQVDRLLEGLLVLARAQHGALHHGALPGRERLALGDVAAAALAARAGAITAKQLTLRHTSDRDPAWVQGNQALLGRMVDNVIDNAIRHNRDGGWIHVATGTDGPAARLVVETGGDVLDPRQVEQLAQPFRRLGADRTGSDRGAGLGLSIVAAIAAAHGGALDLQARREGGLRVSIALPLAERAARAGVR